MILPWVIPVAFGTGAAVTAAVPVCPLPEAAPGNGQALPTCGGGGGGGGGGGAVCPVTLPAPANAFDCACFTAGRDPALRCGSALPQDQCFALIAQAFNDGLLTADGQSWLQTNGFCPFVQDFGLGPQIYDFCPMGCFAGDTALLTSGDDGRTYAPASEVGTESALVSLADEATLSAMALTSRSIDRAVHGPEIPPLYVFTLANGGVLRVTQHHPMVLDSGMIVEAEQVEDGASFAGVDGQPVVVTSITREPATGDVFNFQTAGDTELSHVIVAHGVLVGDLRLQNQLAAEQASIDARR